MNGKLRNVTAARWIVGLGLAFGALLALYGLVVSRGHITEVAYWANIGAPWECETAFLVVDFVIIYGKVLTLPIFIAKTRRIGARLMLGGGVITVACNVGAGFLRGSILGGGTWGAIIVGFIVAIEYAVANTKAKSSAIARPKAEAKPTRKTSTTRRSCAPGCTCGKHRLANNAPVSPGVGPMSTYTGAKA